MNAGDALDNASADTRQPVMFQRGPLRWGLSTRPIAYGQKLLVLLWLYNPSEVPLPVATCTDIDFFWLKEIHVVHSAGKHVASRIQERRAEETRRALANGLPIQNEAGGCFRNFAITIPPHARLHGSFSRPQHDFARDLNEYYFLPPGRYFLAPKKVNLAPSSRPIADQSTKLTITVRNQ